MREIILNKNTMIVSETNSRGMINYANDDFCKIAGYTKEEIIGQPHNIVRHDDMPKVAFEDLWSTVKSGGIWNGIVKNKTKEGDYYWVNATVYKSIDTNNEIRYISVRVKPTEEEVSSAIDLYKRLK